MAKIGVRRVTKEVLHTKFRYEPDTGRLIRKVNSGTAKAGQVAGTLHSLGYREVRVLGRLFKSHRVAWMMTYGEWPNGDIDHINGIRDDNRIENLRVVNDVVNMRNKRVYKSSKTGIHGVYMRRGKWHAVIKDRPGHQMHLGCFDTLLDACCARKSAESKFNYHPNHGVYHG